MADSFASGFNVTSSRTGFGPDSSALLRVALSAGRMSVWQFDLQREVVTVDETISKLFGLPALPGMPRDIPIGFIDALIDPQDLPAVKEAREAAIHGDPVAVEFRIRLGDGSCRWLRSLGEAQFEGETPTHIVGVLYDITRRKDAEGRLRESEEHFRDVFSAIDEGFCICDMLTDPDGTAVDYRFIEVNAHFEEMTGLTNPVGKRALELVPSLERHWIETYARVGIGRESLRIEMPSDAMGRWFNLFATPLAAPGRFAVVFKDVSERKRNEMELAESEAKFRTVTEAMPQMVWSTDAEGRNDFLNQRWQDYLGTPPEALSDGGWKQFFHPADHLEMDRRWSHALATGGTFEIEYRLRHHTGEYRWILGRAIPMRDEDGRVLRWLGTCTDIHEMKLAQERQQLLLDEMDHRVKNILSLVQAVSRQTFGMVPEAEEAQASFSGRIQALAGAYGNLSHESWSQASLRHIILTSLHGCGAHPEAMTLEGPEVLLAPKTAVTFSMAVHELCTNAVKYGALSVPEGRVHVRWNMQDSDRLHFVWQESGGPPVVPPTRRGFGTRMIEHALAAETGGTTRLTFDSEGLRCGVEAMVGPVGETAPP